MKVSQTINLATEKLVAAARLAIPFLQAATLTDTGAKVMRDALAEAVVGYDEAITVKPTDEFTAETYCVFASPHGDEESGWCVKHGDDTVCDVYGSAVEQKVIAETIAAMLNYASKPGLKRLLVEYLDDVGDNHTVDYFACWADDNDHAKEQCEDAYPNCTVTAIFGLIHSYRD